MRTPVYLAVLAGLVVLLLSTPGAPGAAKDLAAAGWLERAAASTIVDMTNEARAGRSLAELALNPHLTLAAGRYAGDMAWRDWFDHVAPEGTTVVDRAEAAGYLDWAYLAENLARGAGHADAADVVAGWMGSAGHRDNLLSPLLGETGVACYVRPQPELRYWCVQAFGAKRP